MLSFFLHPITGMAKKNNVGKTVGLILLSLLIVGGLVGGSISIKKYMDNKSSILTSQNVSDITSNNTETNSSSQTPVSQPSSETSTNSNSNLTETVVPTINCSAPQEVYWYNTADQIDLNETMFVATINGLPSNASDSDRELYLWCDDEDLDDWIEFYVMRSGNKIVLNQPYNFMSGETVHAEQKHKAPATGFYKIPVWIYAVNYEPDDVHSCIDFWFYQR